MSHSYSSTAYNTYEEDNILLWRLPVEREKNRLVFICHRLTSDDEFTPDKLDKNARVISFGGQSVKICIYENRRWLNLLEKDFKDYPFRFGYDGERLLTAKNEKTGEIFKKWLP